MMMKRLMTAALAALILAATPGVALAQESTTTERSTESREDEATVAEREAVWIEKIKARALEAIEKRLTTIDDLERAINRSENIDPDHAEQLLGELRTSAAGLESLAGAIRAAEDLETLRVLIPQIFEDYRIYAVAAPKVHLVVAADAAGAIADRLGEATDSLGAVLDRLEEQNIEVADAQALLTEMERLVASGSESAAKVPGMVLGLTPADYPGSTKVLRSAQAGLQSAGADLRAAGETAHEIVRFIKSVVGGDDTD
jgi:hypothetical protein